MKKWWNVPSVRRLLSSLVASALLAVVTGPPGGPTTPAAGFKGSFAQKSAFFGLFETQRWAVFLFLGFVLWGLWSFWLAKGRSVRSVVSSFMAKPQEVVRKRSVRWSLALIFVVLGFLLPTIVTDPFWQVSMVEEIAIYVLLALGLNVVVGFAGLLDLGFVAFYAIGAYTTAWVTGALPMAPLFGMRLNPFWAIPVAIVLVMAAGVILGTPTLRLRGDYLAIVTLGFGEIIFIFANNLTTVTGGATGSKLIPHFSVHLGSIKYMWGLGPVPYYYLAFGFIILFLIIFSMLEHSRVGRTWTAIREDEVAAESIGINPLKYKVMAFAIGAASSGFAGVLTAAQTNFLSPATFTLTFSINILVLVIFGGMGSIGGVLLGAIVIQSLTMFLIHTPPAGFQAPDVYIYLGALLVIMMIFRPAGLLPSRRRRREIGLAEAGEGHMNEVLTGDET